MENLVGKFHLYRENHVGEIIAQDKNFVLVKYSFGQYCLNALALKQDQLFDKKPIIIEDKQLSSNPLQLDDLKPLHVKKTYQTLF